MTSGRIQMEFPSGVAVDFGGTKLSAARVTAGKIGPVMKVQTDGGGDAAHQMEAICDMLDQLELRPEERVGVALTGRVSNDGVWHAVNTDTLSGVHSVPVRALLSARLDRDVKVDNDATAAAGWGIYSGCWSWCRVLWFYHGVNWCWRWNYSWMVSRYCQSMDWPDMSAFRPHA